MVKGKKDDKLVSLFSKNNKQSELPTTISDSDIKTYLEALNPSSCSSFKQELKDNIRTCPTLPEDDFSRFTENTIFIANVPLQCTQSAKTKSEFIKELAFWLQIPVSDILSLRFRCIPLITNDKGRNLPKSVAISKNLIDTTRDSVSSYVKLASCYQGDFLAKAASRINGKVFLGKHLRADIAVKKGDTILKFDEKRTIFIGNLPKHMEEENLRKLFLDKSIQHIARIKLVRDSKTQQCKGIGFVEFDNPNSAKFALNLLTLNKEEGLNVDGHKLRIFKCDTRKSANEKQRNEIQLKEQNIKKRHPPKVLSNGMLNRAAKRQQFATNLNN